MLDRTAGVEQRFSQDQAKAAADATKDPAKAAEDLAKAEADRQRGLAEISQTQSGSGSSGSGSDSSGSHSSGEGSSGSGSSDASGSGGSSSLRELAREENPEFDPRGFPIRRNEVVALDLSDEGLARAKSAGFSVIARDRLEALSGTVTRLDIPHGLSPEAALAGLRAIEASATFDYTHYYGLQFTSQGATPVHDKSAAMHRRSGNLTLGMIDTAVAAHAALVGTLITQKHFGVRPGANPQANHGTAVASILANEGSRRLLVADVFRGSAGEQFTSADAIAQSIEWMAERKIAVVNISLAGPRNAILDRLIERASTRGMIIVAAAGNAGPTAPPAYPAALGSVVAVTAVDALSRVYRYANQGDYIAVAARGVAEPAADIDGGIARYSGTSFATPHIAAWLARCIGDGRANGLQCRERLRLAARDLGSPGRDPIYGWGVIDQN